MPLSYASSRTVAPATLPVEVYEAKEHCRILNTDPGQDFTLECFIGAATELLEEQAGIALVTQQWQFRIPYFGVWISLPRPPLSIVDEITYVDVDGVSQVLDSAVYDVHPDAYPGVITLAPNEQWPEVNRDSYLPITIKYTCGLDAVDIDKRAKQAINLLVSHWYEHREDAQQVNLNNIPNGYDALRRSLTVGTYTRT